MESSIAIPFRVKVEGKAPLMLMYTVPRGPARDSEQVFSKEWSALSEHIEELFGLKQKSHMKDQSYKVMARILTCLEGESALQIGLWSATPS